MAMTKKVSIVLAAMTAVLAFGEDAAPVAAEAAVEAVKEEAPAVAEAVQAEAAEPVAAAPVVEAAPVVIEEPVIVEVKAGEAVPDGEDTPNEEEDIPGAEVSESSDPSKISLSLDAVELPDVVRLFTRLSGANIICNTTNLNGTVTANLNDVDWQAALKHILDLQGLDLAEKPAGSGIFVISSVAPDAPPKTFTKTYKLDYIKASEAQTVIEGLLGLDKAGAANKKASSKKTATKKDDETQVVELADVAIAENGRVVSYPAANIIIVTATEDKLLEVEKVISEIDVERPQVFIEAKIIQVKGDAHKAIGIDWSFLDGYTISAGPFNRRYTKASNRNNGSTFAHTENNAFFNRNYLGSEVEYPDTISGATDYEGRQDQSPWDSVYRIKSSNADGSGKTQIWSSDSNGRTSARSDAVTDVKTAIFDAPAMQVAISALETSDDVATISNPRLIVANEERAVIDMTTKDPYIIVDETKSGTGTDSDTKLSEQMSLIPKEKDVHYIEGAFFSYGIRVDVTPRVNNPTNITVVIEPSLSDKIGTKGSTLTEYPKIDVRSVKTTFSLGNGQTAVIGGLTQTHDEEVEKKVPVLGSIPILGYFFRHNVKEKRQIETIIFVTVGIVDSNNRESALALPDGARLTQKRIDGNGKIIDKHVFDDGKARAEKEKQEFLKKAAAEGVLVPAAVEE